jgi:hypothetical protein
MMPILCLSSTATWDLHEEDAGESKEIHVVSKPIHPELWLGGQKGVPEMWSVCEVGVWLH